MLAERARLRPQQVQPSLNLRQSGGLLRLQLCDLGRQLIVLGGACRKLLLGLRKLLLLRGEIRRQVLQLRLNIGDFWINARRV